MRPRPEEKDRGQGNSETGHRCNPSPAQNAGYENYAGGGGGQDESFFFLGEKCSLACENVDMNRYQMYAGCYVTVRRQVSFFFLGWTGLERWPFYNG